MALGTELSAAVALPDASGFVSSGPGRPGHRRAAFIDLCTEGAGQSAPVRGSRLADAGRVPERTPLRHSFDWMKADSPTPRSLSSALHRVGPLSRSGGLRFGIHRTKPELCS